MTEKYDDMINLPRPPSGRPKMPLSARAAQFAPFAALTKFGEEIAESNRVTVEREGQGDEHSARIDEVLREINLKIASRPKVFLRYFVADEKKSGGAVSEVSGAVKKLDVDNEKLIFESGRSISFSSIVRIELL